MITNISNYFYLSPPDTHATPQVFWLSNLCKKEHFYSAATEGLVLEVSPLVNTG